MNESERATFAAIEAHCELTLDEDLLIEYALQDKELNDVLEEYRVHHAGKLGRIARIAAGDWAEERRQYERMEMALDAVRIKFLLTDEQVRRIDRICRLGLSP